MKYGRKPARFTAASVARMHVLAQHLSALGTPPATSPDWVSAVMQDSPSGWLMDGNDTYGDCVIADCAHQEMLRTANNGIIWTPTLTDVLALYAFFQGYTGDMTNLADIQAYLANNDNGCDELTVINYLTQTGWLGHKLDGHANLDPRQLDQIKWATCIFGTSRLGLNLPDSAMGQFNSGEPWTPVANAQLDGGHDVPVVKYDGTWFYVVTWGKLQPVSPAFLTAKYPDGMPYLEEAHAELAFDWVNQASTCPANLNLAQLMADLSAIVEQPQPPAPPSPPPPGPPPTPTPPAHISKGALAFLISDIAFFDARETTITYDQMKANLQNVLDRN